MKRVLRISALLSLMFIYSVSGSAQCDNNQVDEARVQYDIGKFTQCLESLQPCIAKNGFHNDDKLHAYELCAMCYLAMDKIDSADDYIEKLITLDDNYKGDAAGNPERLKLEIAYVRLQLRSIRTSSVSKKSEKIELAPATMQIITAEDIRNRGYMDLESVFYDLPGFDLSKNFGITYSVMYQRGYRSAALTERTLILVDGVQDNEVYSNSAYITKQYSLSNVKRIEIIYGPASTLYGSNAFCGVINIVTKDESDLFAGNGGISSSEKQKNTALTMQTGVGSYNTKYVDGTIAARHKDIFFTATGRVYTSDGPDFSSDSRWDGKPDIGTAGYISTLSMLNTSANAKYLSTAYYQLNAKGDSIIPTTAGIKRAYSLDSLGYASSKYKDVSQFRNPMVDFCISAKLVVNNFKFGFQYWNKNEGAVGDFVDVNASVNSKYNNWQVRQYYVYAQYDRKLLENLSLSSLTYYEYSDLGNDTRVMHYNGYAGAAYNADSLIKGVNTKFATTYYSQQSNQFRSELKLPYVINEYFDLLAGTSLTTGIDQANYLTSSTMSGIQNATIPKATASLPGGNNLTEYTLSGYLTASYHNSRLKLNIDAGGRLDNNAFRNDNGYGTVFNPRYDVVYYPGNFVFKAIYSEAFMDASPLNKFSTSATRALANPSLEPEKAVNYEVSAKYKFAKEKRDNVELAAYRANYTHSIGYVYVLIPGTTSYTDQYKDIGESIVYGVQLSSEVFVQKNIAIFGNVTFTDPISTYNSVITNSDSVTLRTGDIATVSANAGVNISFLKKHFNLNARVNFVGDKPTGAKTSVTLNPNADIPGYQILSATLGYRFKKNYLVQFGCNNILNSVYYSPGVRDANDIVYPSSVPQPLRNYYLKMVVSLRK